MNKPHTYKVSGFCIIDKLNFNLYNILKLDDMFVLNFI